MKVICVTGRKFVSQEKNTGKELTAIRRKVLSQEGHSCHRRKFLSQEGNSCYMKDIPVTERKFMLKENISGTESTIPINEVDYCYRGKSCNRK